MSGGLLVGTFVAGLAVGALVSNRISIAAERFRRARRDFRAAKAGLKTLIEMMAKRGWAAAKWAALGALVTITAVVALWRTH